MNATGDGLIYSTCFGSIYFSNAYGIAVDSSGKAYITGNDTTGGLPTTPGAYQPAYAGANGYGGDAFLTVFDPSASGTASLIYSTYLGGSNDDIGFAVAVDVFGMAYVTGSTQSRNFPVTPGAFQSTYPGAVEDVFVAKFNPSASGATSLIYSTYLGGNGIGPSGSSGYDIGHGIAVDAVGQAHVTGQTGSANFPVTPGAFQTTQLWHSGFITTLNAAGNGLVQSTFLGGSSGDQNSASAIALDSMGDAYLTGTTGAPDFPTTPNAFQPSLAGGLDAFVTELNPAGTALVYSSYLGGTQLNQGNGIAVDAVGDAYVTGFTESLNFPTTPFAFQPVIHTGGAWGPADAFVTKLPLGSPGGLSITGVLPNQGGNAGPATVTIVGSGFHAGAIVKLLGGGGSIVGNPPSVGIEGRTMQTTFDLTAAATGSRDLVVTNPDGTISTLSQGFTVATAGAPDIWLDLLGLPGLRESQPQFYYLVYGNRGNIDSPTLRLWISFYSFLSWNPIPNQNPASQGHLNGRTYLAFDVSPTARSNGLIPIALTAPNSHQTFLIQAWEEGR